MMWTISGDLVPHNGGYLKSSHNKYKISRTGKGDHLSRPIPEPEGEGVYSDPEKISPSGTLSGNEITGLQLYQLSS